MEGLSQLIHLCQAVGIATASKKQITGSHRSCMYDSTWRLLFLLMLCPGSMSQLHNGCWVAAE